MAHTLDSNRYLMYEIALIPGALSRIRQIIFLYTRTDDRPQEDPRSPAPLTRPRAARLLLAARECWHNEYVPLTSLDIWMRDGRARKDLPRKDRPRKDRPRKDRGRNPSPGAKDG